MKTENMEYHCKGEKCEKISMRCEEGSYLMQVGGFTSLQSSKRVQVSQCCNVVRYPVVFSTSFDMRNCGKAAWFIEFRDTRRIDASY